MLTFYVKFDYNELIPGWKVGFIIGGVGFGGLLGTLIYFYT